MKGKIKKLYDRLDCIEPKLEELLKTELQKESKGNCSMFLTRLLQKGFDGKFYQNDNVREIEKLANEVIGLREKLGESVNVGVSRIILDYMVFKKNNEHLFGEKRLEFARRKLDQINSVDRKIEKIRKKPF